MLKLGFAVAVLVYNKFIIVPTSHGVRLQMSLVKDLKIFNYVMYAITGRSRKV